MYITKRMIIHLIALTAFLVMTTVPAFAAELKIGYVRPPYIFDNYDPYKEAQKKLQEYEKTETDKLQKQKDGFQKNYEDASKKALVMSEEAIAQKRDELAKQKETLDKAVDDLYKQGGQLDQKQDALVQPIIQKIHEAISKIGKANGYDFIIDAEQGVLYADEKYDISTLVLEELKKGVPAK
jgi:outer membrane protein